MDTRLIQLFDWVGQCYPGAGFEIEPASNDASFRRYFRVRFDTDRSLIAMDAPPEKEPIADFIRIGKLLDVVGVHVPKLHHINEIEGFILMEDLGGEDYQPNLNNESANILYQDAFDALIKIQQSSADTLSTYDKAFLTQEMELFPQWYLNVHQGYEITKTERRLLDETFDFLAVNACSQPQVFVHRDYHSRNLMVTAQNNPGVIDFQDAMHGAITYDLVSLLRDVYIEWSQNQVYSWVEAYRQQSHQAGLHNMDEQTFKRAFDLMGLQRHLKIAGIFARLYHRDGKDKYLDNLPLTMKYIKTVSAEYEELSEFSDWVNPR